MPCPNKLVFRLCLLLNKINEHLALTAHPLKNRYQRSFIACCNPEYCRIQNLKALLALKP